MNQNKLGFEPSEFRCWIGKVCTFLKLKQLVYLNTCLALFQKPIIYTLLTCRKILQHFTVELMFSSIPFFPSILLKWKKDDRKIQQSKTILSFRNYLLKLVHAVLNQLTKRYDLIGLKLLITLAWDEPSKRT